MAAEPQQQPQQQPLHTYPALVARPPTVRPQTRTKVIEILAGNANGCLLELGYTPGLLERARYLEELTQKSKATNDELFRKGRAWQERAEALQVKADTFQSENVKLYEDNVKLVAECDVLRKQLAKAEKICVVYEESRDKDGAALLKEYGKLAAQYAEAVGDLQRYTRIAAQNQLQTQPHASGSQIRPPVLVSSQQPLRRASAPGAQPHSPLTTQPQQIPPTRSHPSMIQVLPMHRTSSAPLGWQQPPSPASVPIPNSHSYSALIAGGLPYNRGSANSNVNPNTNANASAGTSTGAAPFPPTPPMSALPLNLQNFASPASQRAPPRTASASSSQAQRTPVAVQSPALASVPPTPPEEPQESAPPEEMQQDTPPEDMQQDTPPEDDGAAPETHQASTPPDPHEAITPPPHGAADASGMRLASDSLKRASPRVDGEDPRKRARTEEPEVKMEVDETALGDDEEEEEEEEDGNEVDYIEVGADGLRTIPDCVNAMFDLDQGNVCRFCMARFNDAKAKGVAIAPPQGLAGASVEELAAHCEAEHEYAWNRLRTNV